MKHKLTYLLGGLAIATASFDSSFAAVKSEGTKDQQDLDKAIESYIKEHPEVVAKALESYAIQQQTELQKMLQEHLKKYKKELIDLSTAVTLGNKSSTENAVIVFYDVNCPHCRRLGKIIKDLRAKNKDLPIILRPWSILGKDSESVAEVLLASDSSGNFEKLLYGMFESEERLSLGKAYEIANKLGLKEDSLMKTVKSDSSKIQKMIDENKTLAKNLSLSGTPVIILKKGDKLGIVDLRSGISAEGLNKYFTESK